MNRENIYSCAKNVRLIYATNPLHLDVCVYFFSVIAIDNRNSVHKIVLNILFASQFKDVCAFFISLWK